jgi:Rad3-related DNA helicase
VYDIFTSTYEDVEVLIQTPAMAEDAREEFLASFKENPEKATLGFCVLGGIYSEGIDLKSDRLIGAIIVGVGLPQICLERDIIKAYFDSVNEKGFEYSYMYPGMNKVLQAAGRVIRSETDTGVILLIDERFSYGSYQSLFPKEWFPNVKVDSRNLDRTLSNFWEKADLEYDQKKPEE